MGIRKEIQDPPGKPENTFSFEEALKNLVNAPVVKVETEKPVDSIGNGNDSEQETPKP